MYYTFTCLRGLLFFTVVILIGTGWSFMNSHVLLEERTKQVLLLVIPLQVRCVCWQLSHLLQRGTISLHAGPGWCTPSAPWVHTLQRAGLLSLLLLIPQVLANLAIIITNEESPAFNAWLTWKDLLHLVDIVCCCAVLFPVRARATCNPAAWHSLPAAASSLTLSVYTLWRSSATVLVSSLQLSTLSALPYARPCVCAACRSCGRSGVCGKRPNLMARRRVPL